MIEDIGIIENIIMDRQGTFSLKDIKQDFSISQKRECQGLTVRMVIDKLLESDSIKIIRGSNGSQYKVIEEL